MKYSITDTTNIEKIPRDTQEIHLTRPIKLKKLKALIEKCSIKRITIATSCLSRLSSKTKKMIKEKGIELGMEKCRGRPISLPLDKLLNIIELRKDFQTLREIEKVTGIPKSTVHYLVKYADRAKIKKDREVIYLK